MKNIFLLLAISFFAFACNSQSHDHSEDNANETANTIAGNYGDTEWESIESIGADQLVNSLEGKDSVYTVVSGTINAACQAKGCWMTMDAGDNEIFVKFKDYGFFVPKNSAEHDATMRGWAFSETQSVADQIEYAKDAEASEEEIAQITEPKVKLTFVADGVIIQ